jgi:hypothetical protein
VPSDTPVLTPYSPDWATSVQECLALRPELSLIRQELKFRQLDLIRERNQLLPDLRFSSTYDINGIGSRLDGAGVDNAHRSLSRNDFHNWALGLRLEVPIGFREAHTSVRIARLQLARTYGILQEQELRAQHFLAQQYNRLIEQYELIRAQRAQREAAATQLEARYKQYIAGQGTLDILLESQRVWADALRDEFNAVAQYNSALAGFEFAKGTIMEHDNVYIAEGGYPHCAGVRAVEHERERAVACVLRERAKPVAAAPCCPEQGQPGIPYFQGETAPSLPALFEGQPLKEKWEELPAPRLSDQTSARGALHPAPGAVPSLRSVSGANPPTTLPAMAPAANEPPAVLDVLRQRMFPPTSPSTAPATAPGSPPTLPVSRPTGR